MIGGALAVLPTASVPLELLALVGAGGTAGAMARYAVTRRVEGSLGGTLVVNVLGSAGLGFLTAATDDPRVALVIGAGVCGAFTTFSSFAVGTVSLADDGDGRRAAVYAVVTLALALVAVAVGGVVGLATRRFLP